MEFNQVSSWKLVFLIELLQSLKNSRQRECYSSSNKWAKKRINYEQRYPWIRNEQRKDIWIRRESYKNRNGKSSHQRKGVRLHCQISQESRWKIHIGNLGRSKVKRPIKRSQAVEEASKGVDKWKRNWNDMLFIELRW